MKKGGLSKQITAMLLSTIMAVTMLPLGGFGMQTVSAAEEEKTVAGLSTSVIKEPIDQKTYDPETGYMNSWAGSYVWYGKYDGTPVRYRVLSPKTTKYGGTTMFLDSEFVLYETKYDEDSKANSGQTNPNEWDGSDLKTSLNGLDFLWKAGGFTDLERSAIKGSTIAGHSRALDENAKGCLVSPLSDFEDFTPLTGEKIFVLDIGELIPQYGYIYPSKRGLDGEAFMWWTRSAHKLTNPAAGRCVGYVPNYVYSYGDVDGSGLSWRIGASPAFNVDLNKVIFSSVVSGTAGEDNAEYKLTLTDNKMKLALAESNGVSASALISADKTDVSMRLQLTGANADQATQLSVLFLDQVYQSGNANGASILHYEKLYVPAGISKLSTPGFALFSLPSNFNITNWDKTYYVYVLAEDVNGSHETDYASVPLRVEKPKISVMDSVIVGANAKYSSIAKGETQEFTVVTASNVQNLMLYAEGGKALVKSWAASGNSTVSSDGLRTWNVSQAIGTAGDRKLVFKGGTTSTTPVTNAVTVAFKVDGTGVLSASVKNATIQKGGTQEFTVRTTSDMTYLMLYAEGGNLVKTWTANSSNSKVSGNVRTWTVTQSIGTAGKRNLVLKAGKSTTPTSLQKTVSFTVEDTWVNEATAKFATIGKGGTQTFTVKTTASAQKLMLYAEGGNLVKTWAASGNSTVSGDVRTWTVKLAIGTAGNRELTFKAGKITTPSPFGKSVKFTVAEKKIVSVKAKYTAITKTSMQGFTVTTTADVKYLMLYAEDGKTLVKSWAASGNSSVAENNIRTWNVMQSIGTAGDRKLVFKGGTTNTTPVTSASTVSFKVVASGVLTASAKNATMNKGTTQTFTVTTTSDCNYLAEYAESGNLVTTWTANSSNSKVSGNVRTWTVTQTIGTAGKRTLMFKAGKGSTVTAAERSVSFTVK